jgi:hypothetical protein
MNGTVSIENGAVFIQAHNQQDHEQILHNTMAADLRDVVREYLERTRQTNPILYVYDMTGVERDP